MTEGLHTALLQSGSAPGTSMHRMIWALLVAFAVSLVVGPFVIKLLQKLKIGQNVNELAPEGHQKKQGTPTLGGLMFAAVSILVALAFQSFGGIPLWQNLYFMLAVFALLNLGIGFLDDYTKLRGKQNQGLTERQKLIIQTIVAALFSTYCYFHPMVGSMIVVPFAQVEWDLSLFYIPFMTFIIICTTNGSNLLDGLDGLLGSVTSVITGFYAICVMVILVALSGMPGMDAVEYANMQNIGVFMAAASGALLGYLRFNLYPAQMMMGDTGSMYLGGLVVGVAMITRTPLLIPLVAGMYAVSLLSVFMQRWYFRFTKGKRIFKMSPLHHHFELSGVRETKIVSMYTIVTVILCLIALLSIA